MASIYKRTQDKGKRRASWYIGYKDHTGKRRTVKGFSDKGETERLAARLEEEARMVREGLIEPVLEARKEPLERHVASFETHLRNRDITEKQVKEVVGKVNRVVLGCGFQTIGDVTGEAVETFLGELRSEGLSKQTSNHYLRAVKQFCRWLVRTKRINQNPVSDISMLNVKTDRRHDRRPLLPEEFSLLITAAESGPRVESIPGTDRAMMYVLAAWTGYRKSEIGSLTKDSFDLEATPPTVTVSAVYSKRRRKDTQVLHQMVVERLKAWLSTKTETAPNRLLFPVSGKVPGGTDRKTSKMMKKDLKAARAAWIEDASSDEERAKREASGFLLYRNKNGLYADFHATRHTFITNLARAGVSPKTAQMLARHSDIRLTMDVYTHTDLAEKQEAVERLSNLWEHPGSTPVSQSDALSHLESPKEEGETKSAEPKGSAEVVCKAQVDASSQELSGPVKSTPGRIRTCDLRIRSPLLYPAELQGRVTLRTQTVSVYSTIQSGQSIERDSHRQTPGFPRAATGSRSRPTTPVEIAYARPTRTTIASGFT